MPKFTIDSAGNAIAPDGKVVGSRDSTGKIAMLPPEAQADDKQNATPQESAVAQEAPSVSAQPPVAPFAGEFIPVRPAQKQAAHSPLNPPSHPANPAPAPAAISYTKYEVRPDSVFTIRFCLGFRDERVQVYTEDARFKLPGLESHWVTFRMWTFREELDWRNRTTVFDQPTRSWRADPGKFNDLKIRNLLRDWSLAEIDPKFRLLHVNGALCDESYNAVMGLFPNILDNIIYLMNRILEDNG